MGKPLLRRIDVGSVSVPLCVPYQVWIPPAKAHSVSGVRLGVGKDSVPPRSGVPSPMMCRPHPTRDTNHSEGVLPFGKVRAR